MRKLKICVVGLGSMGKLHLKKLSARKEISVMGVESDSTQLNRLKGEFNVPIYRDIDEINEKIDGAIIAVPTSSHFDVARTLLSRDTNLFIEKPICGNSQEARKLLNLAGKRKKTLQVGHIERYNPAFVKITELIDSPESIFFYRLSPFPQRSMDIDVVMDLMIHDIDLALQIVKSEIKQVECSGFKLISKKADIAMAKIKFKNNCVVQFISNRVYTEKVRKFFVFEKNRYYIADLLNFKLIKISPADNRLKIIEEKIQPYDMISAEHHDFIESIKTGKLPRVTGIDGLRAVEVAELITKKMKI